jgi:hypothetical protein
MGEIFPWDAKEGDKSKMQLAPKYPVFDYNLRELKRFFKVKISQPQS